MLTVFHHHFKKLLSSKTFTKYLLFTNIVISGTVDFVGDFTEQRVVEVVQPHDWGRTARMGLIGVLFGAPDHYWYRYLDTKYPGRDRWSVSKKVVLDLLIMGTLGTIVFYIGMCKLEGKSWSETDIEVKDKFLPTFLLELVFWPPIQVINFYYVPPSMRVAYICLIYFGWSMVLSYLKHKNIPTVKIFHKTDK